VFCPSDWSDPATQQEVLGPVPAVLTCSDLEATLGIIKYRPKPRATYILSKDQSAMDIVLTGISFGGGCINQASLHCRIDSFPFDGVGRSRIGKITARRGSTHGSVPFHPMQVRTLPGIQAFSYVMARLRIQIGLRQDMTYERDSC
jgi:acyl-CoA reductase-like NAD-dependent aldehyde dehydrogenase